MKEKRFSCKTNLEGVFLVLYVEGTSTISFKKNENLKGVEFRFVIEGSDGNPIKPEEIRGKGQLGIGSERLRGILSEVFGVGIFSFTEKGDTFKMGTFLSGEFLKNEFPNAWSRVYPRNR